MNIIAAIVFSLSLVLVFVLLLVNIWAESEILTKIIMTLLLLLVGSFFLFKITEG